MTTQIPIINSVEELANHVRSELVARGLVPGDEHIVYSNGDPGQRTTPNQSKLPMVWFWLEKQIAIDVGQSGDPAQVAMDETVDGQPVWTQSIGVEKIRARVVMHALVPEEGMNEAKRRGRVQAKNAERAGTQLRQRIIASIWRALTGSFRVLGAENISPKGSEFAFGSASEMIVEIYNHIPNDAYAYDPATPDTTLEFEGETVGSAS